MQIFAANDVKIYNLSAGKSIPDWISDRKRRKLEQKDIGVNSVVLYKNSFKCILGIHWNYENVDFFLLQLYEEGYS